MKPNGPLAPRRPVQQHARPHVGTIVTDRVADVRDEPTMPMRRVLLDYGGRPGCRPGAGAWRIMPEGGHMPQGMTRRRLIATAAATPLGLPAVMAAGRTPFRLGLTPVFLDNDAAVIAQLRTTFRAAMGQPIELLQRRTYEEVTGLLLEGGIDAAWLCGYPFLQHRGALSLIGVPVWRGKPLYRSCLIAAADDPAPGLAAFEGAMHAFSDPDSNSGWLVTASDLARMGRTPDGFFARTVFTYGHRNVVRAVASGLTRSGSVDGYVWQVLSQVEPQLAGRTRVVSRSEWLGFPPFVARTDRMAEPGVARFAGALAHLQTMPEGRAALRTLHLDGVVAGDAALFDGIAARMQEVRRLR